MIFADKLIQLRKRNGWSQEELAYKLNVTRQSVSKWEGMQSIPDLDKILQMSQLFGVSVDYLVKDQMEETESTPTVDNDSTIRRVSMQEAHDFIEVKARTSKTIAYATLLCILSPICLLILAALTETAELSEAVACAVGIAVLLGIVLCAVILFVLSGRKTEQYEYLEKEDIETEYGVSGMVKELKRKYESTYTKCNIVGITMCILGIIPLIVGGVISENALFICGMLSITLASIGIGVTHFIRCGIIWESYAKLLQEGDYTREKKQKQGLNSAVSLAFWLIAVAIFLTYSFVTNDWEHSWIVWVVAGVTYPALMAILGALKK